MQQSPVVGEVDGRAAKVAAAAPLVASAVVLALALLQILFSQALYGDGAFVVLTVLEQGTWFIVDNARKHALWLNQAPLVWAARSGIHDTHLLSMIYTFGQVALPAACYVLALLYARRNDLLTGGVLLAIAIAYLNAGFVSHGEYVWAYALGTLMVAVLLGRKTLRARDAMLLVILGFVSVRVYEAFVFFGPLCFCVALLRLAGDDPRPRPVVSVLLALYAFLVAAAATISLWAIWFPRDPSNLAGARDLTVLFGNTQLLASFAVAGTLLVTVLAERMRVSAVVGIAAVAFAAVAMIVAPSIWASPLQHYFSRVLVGLALFALLAFLVAMRYLPRRGIWSLLSPWAGARRMFVAGSLVWLATLAVPFVSHSLAWRVFLDEYVKEANARGGVVAMEQTTLLGDRFRPYVWWWTNPSLSHLVRRGPTHAVIRNEAGYGGWQPFDPVQPRPALQAYTWK